MFIFTILTSSILLFGLNYKYLQYRMNRLWIQNYESICRLKDEARKNNLVEFENELDEYLRTYYYEKKC